MSTGTSVRRSISAGVADLPNGRLVAVPFVLLLFASVASAPAIAIGSGVDHAGLRGPSCLDGVGRERSTHCGGVDGVEASGTSLFLDGTGLESAVERIDLPGWLLRDSAIAVAAGLLGSLVGALVVRTRGGSASQKTDGGTSPGEAMTCHDEERIYHLLRSDGGEMKQSQIVERTGWSKAKVSRTLSRMEASKVIRKERVGRQNVIRLEERQ